MNHTKQQELLDFWEYEHSFDNEDAARSVSDFEEVVKQWDHLDDNRERKERYHEIGRENIDSDEQLQRITELQDFIKDQSSDLTVFDEALVKRWLKQIVIWPTHCTVELKSGLKVDVER